MRQPLLCSGYMEMFPLSGQCCGRLQADTQMICWNLDVVRQARSPRLCGLVQAVPWSHKAEQQLSWLAPSVWELSGRRSHFWDRSGSSVPQRPRCYVWSLRWQGKRRVPVTLGLWMRCHWKLYDYMIRR